MTLNLILVLMLISDNIDFDFYFVLIDVNCKVDFDGSISYHPLICSVVAKNKPEKNQKKAEKMPEEMC